MAKAETRSPIKDLPVRFPGQSLHSRIVDVVMDDVLRWWLLAGLFIAGSIFAWVQHYRNTLVQPVLLTVLAVIFTPFAYRKTRSAMAELERLKLGQKGEAAVGQYLEENLRAAGYQVLHDIPAEGFIGRFRMKRTSISRTLRSQFDLGALEMEVLQCGDSPRAY